MNYKKTKMIFFMWLLIFVCMSSFVVFGFVRLKNMKESVLSLEQEVVQEKDSLQAYDSLVKSFANIKSESEKANTYFVKKEEVVNFLDMIESLDTTTNTEISIQSVTDKNTALSSNILSIVINAQGTYSNLYYLVRMLEELPYQTEIQNVRLSNSRTLDENKQSTNNWVADITITGVMF